MNSKIGENKQGVEKYLAKHGLGETNQNGERLIELCELPDLPTANKFFPNKKIQKFTRDTHDKITKSRWTISASLGNSSHQSEMSEHSASRYKKVTTFCATPNFNSNKKGTNK